MRSRSARWRAALRISLARRRCPADPGSACRSRSAVSTPSAYECLPERRRNGREAWLESPRALATIEGGARGRRRKDAELHELRTELVSDIHAVSGRMLQIQ